MTFDSRLVSEHLSRRMPGLRDRTLKRVTKAPSEREKWSAQETLDGESFAFRNNNFEHDEKSLTQSRSRVYYAERLNLKLSIHKFTTSTDFQFVEVFLRFLLIEENKFTQKVRTFLSCRAASIFYLSRKTVSKHRRKVYANFGLPKNRSSQWES